MATNNNTICGFPRRFDSCIYDACHPDNVFFLLRKLLKDTGATLEIDDKTLEFTLTPSQKKAAVVDGAEINLPTLGGREKVCDSSVNALVPYLQELLDLNGHPDLIVMLDHTSDYKFEFLTQEEFLGKLQYPIEEYRADTQCCEGDGTPIMHPNVPHTWAWVALKTAGMFTKGDADSFSPDSVCYRSCYGITA